MNPESGRNQQQPDYLNEKDQAEDRQGITPEDERTDGGEEEAERKSDAAVRNAFRH